MKHNISQHLLKQGIAANKAGQDDDAARLLRQAVELDSDNELAWLWLSGVAEDVVERRYCLEQALEINPQNAQARAGLKWLNQQSGAVDPYLPASSASADMSKQQAADAAPGEMCPFCSAPVSSQSTFCAHCRCTLLITCPACETQNAVHKSACESCGRVLGEYQQGATYFTELGEAYLQNGHTDLAIGAWKNALQLAPNDADVFLRLGQTQLIVNQSESACANLRHAVRYATTAPSLVAAGQVFEQGQQWEEAQGAYEKALTLDGASSGTHFALGRVLIERKAYQAAFPSLRQATKLDPMHAGAWFLLGRLYELADERQRGIQAYESAAALATEPSSKNETWIKRASERLDYLRPSLPENVARNWPETLRQTSALAVIPLLAALINAGLQPWHITPADYLGVLLAVLGAYLWVSASGLPLNPGMRAMLGPDGLSNARVRTAVGLLGGAFWATSLLYLLLSPALSHSLA